MPYPLSSEVVSGQPTAALHYNNLRKDALYLGMDALNSVGLAPLLARFEEGLKLELLNTDRVRVPASMDAPVYLVVNGYILTSMVNVDLATGSKPAGSAAQYYVFATRSPNSLSFTLDVNTTATESTDRRRIGGFYWTGTKIEAASLYTEKRAGFLNTVGLQGAPLSFGGRLTLTSAVAVADTVSSGVVYYTPYSGNRVSLYATGYGWREYTFAELSVSLDGQVANKPVDVFLCNVSGTLTLELEGWTSATVRTVALADQDGVKVKATDPTRLYLGTVGITATPGVATDTTTRRFLWNMYNRVLRVMSAELGYNNWTNTTAAWRAAYGSTDTDLIIVSGLNLERIIIFAVLGMQSTGGSASGVGVGVGVTNANSASIRMPHLHTGLGAAIAIYMGKVAEGFKTYTMLEFGNAGVTFYGSNGGNDAIRSAIEAMVLC